MDILIQDKAGHHLYENHEPPLDWFHHIEKETKQKILSLANVIFVDEKPRTFIGTRKEVINLFQLSLANINNQNRDTPYFLNIETFQAEDFIDLNIVVVYTVKEIKELLQGQFPTQRIKTNT